MKSFSYFIIVITLFTLNTAWGQDKLFFNRIHVFEHQECQHPIGTVFYDKVFYGNNADSSIFMNFNNSEVDTIFVDLIKYGNYTAYNEFAKAEFLAASTVIMGFTQEVFSEAGSINEARSRFRVDIAKDTMVDDMKLKHIRIKPKDTLVHNFRSFNIFINTKAKTELPLYTSPSVHFLLKGNLKDLRGTVVETYFIDLEGYRYCRDVLTGFQIINKRVIVQ